MLHCVPFERAHLDSLQPQNHDLDMKGEVIASLELWTRDQDLAFSAMDAGTVVGIGGLHVIHAGRAVAWSYLSHCGPAKFLRLHRLVKDFLDGQEIARIEAWVRADFPQGHRWMTLLGFHLEAACVRRFCPKGRDYSLYAKIKEETHHG